jgi:hypothetical protein
MTVCSSILLYAQPPCENPQRYLAGYVGIPQAGAYKGFEILQSRSPAGPDRRRMKHGRRKLFDLVELLAPLAAEAVWQIGAN